MVKKKRAGAPIQFDSPPSKPSHDLSLSHVVIALIAVIAIVFVVVAVLDAISRTQVLESVAASTGAPVDSPSSLVTDSNDWVSTLVRVLLAFLVVGAMIGLANRYLRVPEIKENDEEKGRKRSVSFSEVVSIREYEPRGKKFKDTQGVLLHAGYKDVQELKPRSTIWGLIRDALGYYDVNAIEPRLKWVKEYTAQLLLHAEKSQRSQMSPKQASDLAKQRTEEFLKRFTKIEARRKLLVIATIVGLLVVVLFLIFSL